MTHPPGTICVVSNELSRYPAFAMSLLGTKVPEGSKIIWQTGHSIAANRNVVIREMHGDWIWFIDDDHIWESHLLLALLDHQVEIVAPVYVMRYHPFPSSVFVDLDGRGGYTCMAWDTIMHHHGLLSVSAMGAAGLLVRKPVLDAMSDPWFEVGKISSEGLWEDAWFCRKARQAGFSLYVDTDHVLGHISRLVFWPTRTGVEVELAESGVRMLVPEGENAHAT